MQVLIRPTAEQLVLALMLEAAAYSRLLLPPRSEGSCREAEAAWRPVYSYAAAPPAARLALGADTDEMAEALSGALL